MVLQRAAPILVLLLVASVAVMVFAAGRDDRALVAIAAAAFTLISVAVALRINVPAWRRDPDAAAHGASLIRQTTQLAALVYAWGASAMFAVYSLGGLTWRHWWQYGLGMALLGAGLLLYARRSADNPEMASLRPTVLHGAAALGSLVYLLGTNKLATLKDDWAANDVFLFGGLAILALCMIAAITLTRISQR